MKLKNYKPLDTDKIMKQLHNGKVVSEKGGCNPIVIDYEVKDGQIIVPIEGLVLHERKFK